MDVLIVTWLHPVGTPAIIANLRPTTYSILSASLVLFSLTSPTFTEIHLPYRRINSYEGNTNPVSSDNLAMHKSSL